MKKLIALPLPYSNSKKIHAVKPDFEVILLNTLYIIL